MPSMDERFCRFATKVVINGIVIADGVMSVSAIDILINRVLFENEIPMINFKDLYKAKEGHHMHFDITFNGTFIAFEIAALSGPVMVAS